MPWTVSTYAGTYMGGSPSNARTALFELMRGVNERQGAMDITKTKFYKTDGTQAADLSMADILNIRASGVESNVEKNLKRVRDAIISMSSSGRFTTTTGGTTVWTKASMETTLGEDLDAGPIRPQEARFWQTMQNALDLLLYGKTPYALAHPSPSGQRRTGTGATKAIAWSAAVADSPSAVSAQYAVWQNAFLTAIIDDNVSVDLDLSNFGGVISGGDMVLDINNGSDIDINWTIDLISDILPSDIPGAGSEDISYHYWSASLPTGGVYPLPVTIDTTLPGSNPFVTFNSNVQVGFTSFNLYTDLESVLSDQ